MVAGTDFEPAFSGKHDNSILGVANKDYPAAAIANSVMSRMIEREVDHRRSGQVDLQVADLPDHRLRRCLQPQARIQDKIKEAFFTFPWEGSSLKKEFEKSNEGQFLEMNYKDFWDVIRKIDAANQCRIHLRVNPSLRRRAVLARRRSVSRRGPMLELKNLSKTYRTGDKALQNVTLTVPKGQVMALIGPSGAGKSTLIRCINRLVEPTSGKVISTAPTSRALSSGALRKMRAQDGHDLPGIRAGRTPDGDGERAVGRLGYVGFWRSFCASIRKLMSTRPFACSTASACWPWPTSAPTNCPAVSASASASPAR
jgi:hypothetical protein